VNPRESEEKQDDPHQHSAREDDADVRWKQKPEPIGERRRGASAHAPASRAWVKACTNGAPAIMRLSRVI
jgi:hypothetical protein